MLYEKKLPNGTLKIDYDSDPLNPREENDNLAHMSLKWNRYDLGDGTDPTETLRELVLRFIPEEEIVNKAKEGRFVNKYPANEDGTYASVFPGMIGYTIEESEIYDDCIEALRSNEMMVLLQGNDNIVLLPCFIYEHSGLTISCSNGYPYNDRWDAGYAGFVYMTSEDYKKEYGNLDNWKSKAREICISEVKTYDLYLTGSVYMFQYEEDDSGYCWGCGDIFTDKYGKDLIDYIIKEYVEV